ncbi:MAG: hypothetical protein NWE96_01865 [Candidatus Bathyarchaeota archaeon]|nr:hypothetical protein [Candidatus Bathyarchaeota archaeon]
MSALLNRDATIETVLKKCSNCGHPRGSHRKDRECTVLGCICKQFSQ